MTNNMTDKNPSASLPSPAEVHQSALVIDTHADTPQRFLDESWDFTSPLNGGMINLASARQGNLAAEFFAAWVDPGQYPANQSAIRTLALIDATLEQVRRHPNQLQLCLTPADILAAHQAGKFAILLGIEGGHSIENSLGLLRTYHRLGVRYMTLTWSNTNDWADSSGDIDDPTIPHHNGLTSFGRHVVSEMNRLGMMVDISHASDKTFWDVLQITRAPIIASHSSSRSLTDAPRNLTDDMLRAVAKNNGVVMVNFYPSFIDQTWRDAWKATQSQRDSLYDAAAEPYRQRGKPVPYSVPLAIDREFYAQHFAATQPLPPLSSLIDHFDHIAKVAGIDHVGVGTDFDGFAMLPQGISSAADLPKITEALVARGYSAEDLHKLLGGNLLRTFAAVQAAADSSQM
jgi:membrane dipeptidase